MSATLQDTAQRAPGRPALSDQHLVAVRYAIRDGLLGQAQFVLDEIKTLTDTDPDWQSEDHVAGLCEQLAWSIRAVADIGFYCDHTELKDVR